MAVTPIHRAKTVKRMVVSTYQAASGAGQAAMEELEAQTKAVLEGTEVPMNIFPFQYAFNLFSHNAPMGDNGYNEEVRRAGACVIAIARVACDARLALPRVFGSGPDGREKSSQVYNAACLLFLTELCPWRSDRCMSG
jgi:Semialdehyde dehydrogenase, dimerisation domain